MFLSNLDLIHVRWQILSKLQYVAIMQNTPSPQLVIDPCVKQKKYLIDLFRCRELFYFLAWRDVLVRYKQAVFGMGWALLRPILSMAVFVFIFSKIADLPSMDVSYPLFVLAGMLPWMFFASSSVDMSTCLINNTSLISKVYFPRMIIPVAQMIVNLLDFSVATLFFLIIGFFSSDFNFWTLLSLPLWILLVICLNTGVGLWLSALTVNYRDVRILVPFFVQFGMFLTPVGYGSFLIPEKWQILYSLNPLVGIIDGFRWAFFGISYPNMWISISIAICMTALLLVSGFLFFRKTERFFADMI